ncbi:nuclear transport factor 2-like [Rhopilema esculentum]|uniref:nuclear transport factor 2-like n=1 Tax=Rhopilema esculentum TaxID=499914 RepID=UPI0031DE4251
MADMKTIANQFVQHYYTTFDNSREQLINLYVPQSTLSFEGTDLQGEVQISEKLKGLPFQKVEHSVTTVDVQPTVDNGLIVFVIGQLKTDSDPPHGFSQVFHLKQNPVTNSLVVLNDIFRLMLHHG